MWIVKLGGSLVKAQGQGPLLPWLRMLAAFGGGRVAVVPGGAGFADAVRQAQGHWGFDELAAHNMALLAMAQTALMMHALEPRLALVSQQAQIPPVLRAGRVALWMPLDMVREVADTDTNWEVSADSLALGLARRLHAERLVVVKSCTLPHGRSLAQLAEDGVLDTRFAAWAADAPFPIELVEQHRLEAVRDALVHGE